MYKKLATLLCLSTLIFLNCHAQSFQLEITSPKSLVRVGMDPHPTDSSDVSLAYTLLGALDNQDIDSIKYVREKLREKAASNITIKHIVHCIISFLDI